MMLMFQLLYFVQSLPDFSMSVEGVVGVAWRDGRVGGGMMAGGAELHRRGGMVNFVTGWMAG